MHGQFFLPRLHEAIGTCFYLFFVRRRRQAKATRPATYDSRTRGRRSRQRTSHSGVRQGRELAEWQQPSSAVLLNSNTHTVCIVAYAWSAKFNFLLPPCPCLLAQTPPLWPIASTHPFHSHPPIRASEFLTTAEIERSIIGGRTCCRVGVVPYACICRNSASHWPCGS